MFDLVLSLGFLLDFGFRWNCYGFVETCCGLFAYYWFWVGFIVFACFGFYLRIEDWFGLGDLCLVCMWVVLLPRGWFGFLNVFGLF